MDLGRRVGVERLVRRPTDGLWSGRGTCWGDCWESGARSPAWGEVDD